MTALMSLISRLGLAKLALQVRAEQADVERLAPALAAGIDLLVIGSCGDDERDTEALLDFRTVYAQQRILLAIGNPGAARQASADVVYLERPQRRIFGGQPPRGHEWTLLGRGARDQRTVGKPGDEYAFLFVGPILESTTELLRVAVAEQPPFAVEAIPWFAAGGFDLAGVQSVLAAGSRRVALTSEVLDRDGDSVEFIAAVKVALNAAWAEDQNSAAAYRRLMATR